MARLIGPSEASREVKAIVAGGGQMGVSPTPRTPNGWPGFGTSTMIVSIIGTSKQVGMR